MIEKLWNFYNMATLFAKSHFIYFIYLFSGLCQRLHFSQIAFSTLQMVENGSFSKLLAPFYIFAISLVPRSDFFPSCFKYRRLYTQMLRSRPDLRSHGNSMPSWSFPRVYSRSVRTSGLLFTNLRESRWERRRLCDASIYPFRTLRRTLNWRKLK